MKAEENAKAMLECAEWIRMQSKTEEKELQERERLLLHREKDIEQKKKALEQIRAEEKEEYTELIDNFQWGFVCIWCYALAATALTIILSSVLRNDIVLFFKQVLSVFVWIFGSGRRLVIMLQIPFVFKLICSIIIPAFLICSIGAALVGITYLYISNYLDRFSYIFTLITAGILVFGADVLHLIPFVNCFWLFFIVQIVYVIIRRFLEYKEI